MAANPDDATVATTTARDDPKKWMTYDALEKMMPNGKFLYNDLTRTSNRQSKKLYHKKMIINKSLKLKAIKPADTVFLYCNYGDCANNKHRHQTFKATQFKTHHWDKAHKGVEMKQEYFKVFSVWKVDYENKKYLQEYIQLRHNGMYYHTLEPNNGNYNSNNNNNNNNNDNINDNNDNEIENEVEIEMEMEIEAPANDVIEVEEIDEMQAVVAVANEMIEMKDMQPNINDLIVGGGDDIDIEVKRDGIHSLVLCFINFVFSFCLFFYRFCLFL